MGALAQVERRVDERGERRDVRDAERHYPTKRRRGRPAPDVVGLPLLPLPIALGHDSVVDAVALAGDGVVDDVDEHARVDLALAVDPERADRLGLRVVVVAGVGDGGEDLEEAEGELAEPARDGAADWSDDVLSWRAVAKWRDLL